MAGRPKIRRRIASKPTVSGFRPYGGEGLIKKTETIFLLHEEYEALRLNDYEKNTQCESARIMGVSRPTFTRIYINAREKIATAFVEGRKIMIEGGKVYFNDEWYICQKCQSIFNLIKDSAKECPLCGSKSYETYTDIPVEKEKENEPEEVFCEKGNCKRRRRRENYN
ncbi:MAG: DUF134 domain-containing protein [Bacteroidetes bacterium]|nr:DUF134 domain-containing protein [Bacteroidota bacterium]